MKRVRNWYEKKRMRLGWWVDARIYRAVRWAFVRYPKYFPNGQVDWAAPYATVVDYRTTRILTRAPYFEAERVNTEPGLFFEGEDVYLCGPAQRYIPEHYGPSRALGELAFYRDAIKNPEPRHMRQLYRMLQERRPRDIWDDQVFVRDWMDGPSSLDAKVIGNKVVF